MSDYDKSIHSNPDAKSWAKFFIETINKNKEILYRTLPALSSQKRELKQELEWTSFRCSLLKNIDPRNEDEQEYQNWKELDNQRFQEMVEYSNQTLNNK